MTLTSDKQKEQAARAAVDQHVRSGMKVGLGTGSTAKHAMIRLAEKLKSGELKDVTGVPTSKATQEIAKELGLPIVELDDVADCCGLAVTIDGADSVRMQDKAIIKGAGGALFREKMVATATDHYVIVADESKICREAHLSCLLPVEVAQFGVQHTLRRLQKAFPDAEAQLRVRDGETFVTDNGNFIVDLKSAWKDVNATHKTLKSILGVVEHGLFLGFPKLTVIWATAQGETHSA